MDITLHYIEKGCGEPFVLLHGNGESGEYFARQLDFFSQHYRVIAVDARGHGHSPRGQGRLTLGIFADDLYAFFQRLGIKRAHILGFSDGGNLALIFALRYPERVNRLIVNGANLHPFGLRVGVLVPTCLAWLAACVQSVVSKKAIGRRELLALMVLEPRINASALKLIKSPVLVIAGSHDMIRKRHTIKIWRHVKNGTLVFLDGTHFIASENSQLFNEAVNHFLSK